MTHVPRPGRALASSAQVGSLFRPAQDTLELWHPGVVKKCSRARDRAGAGDGAGLPAVRRGSLGTGPGTGGRSARYDAPACRRGHDIDLRSASPTKRVSPAMPPTGSPVLMVAVSRGSVHRPGSLAHRVPKGPAASWPKCAEEPRYAGTGLPGQGPRPGLPRPFATVRPPGTGSSDPRYLQAGAAGGPAPRRQSIGCFTHPNHDAGIS